MNFAELHGWIGQHTEYAIFVVFLMAFAESLVLLGLLMPGIAIMLAFGALVGDGTLPFWPVCFAAIAGGIIGDWLSYQLGHHYHDRIGGIWPFTRHPELLKRGTDFFHRYGQYSIVFGRFFGPVRAVVPLVAGMLNMPSRRFFWVNVLSACFWAPATLLPGVVLGASLELASAVAGRLVVLILVLLALLWLAVRLGLWLFGHIQTIGYQLILAAFHFSRNHPLIRRLSASLLDPYQPDYPGLIFTALISASMVAGASCLPEFNLSQPYLADLTHPLADRFFFIVSQFANWPQLLGFFAIMVTGLAMNHQKSAALHLFLGGVVAIGLAVMPRTLGHPNMLDGGLLVGVVVYGFVAAVVARPGSKGWRRFAYPLAAALLAMLFMARQYSGECTVLAASLSFLFGFIWLLPLSTGWYRHTGKEQPTGLEGLLPLILLTLLALYNGQNQATFPTRHPPAVLRMILEDWQMEGWQLLPASRDLGFGRQDQSFTLQWAGELPTIRNSLLETGWIAPEPWDSGQSIASLNPSATINQLPILPHFNQTDPDALRLIRKQPNGQWLVIRLWPAHAELLPDRQPLWLGCISALEDRDLMGFIKYAHEQPLSTDTLDGLLEELAGKLQTVHLKGNGSLLLLLSR